MLYLSLCIINGQKPDIAYVEKIDLDELYKECNRHNITALVSYALETVIELPKKWSDAKGKSIRKSMLYDFERELITDFMNENGIKYMLLKGVLLKELYPEIGMREMSDNDIYYDIAFREKLEEFMLSLGYKCDHKDNNHDVYEKEPIYNLEFHHAFFSKITSERLYKYYIDIEKRMVKNDDNPYGYHLSNEDLYIYLIAHEYKHYTHFGTGIRSLLDCIVFLSKFGNTLDWNYINSETNKIKISKFEKSQRDLCYKLLNSNLEADLTEQELEFIEYLISSGVHGTYSIGVLNQARGKVELNSKITFAMKVKYIFRRLFPPLEFYKIAYPHYYKNKFSIPLCFLFRIYRAIFKRSKVIKNEINILNK